MSHFKTMFRTSLGLPDREKPIARKVGSKWLAFGIQRRRKFGPLRYIAAHELFEWSMYRHFDHAFLDCPIRADD
jgi:hypothetical protein